MTSRFETPPPFGGRRASRSRSSRVLASSWGVDLRLGHARRLMMSGRRDAALRVYAAVQTDIGADLRRARRGTAR